MVVPIIINASLLVISVCAGLITLFKHTDFPKGMTYDEIEDYRVVAANHSKKVKGCAAAAIVLGFVFYVAIPVLCFVFSVDYTIVSFCAALFAFVQMAVIQLVFKIMSDRLNV